MLATQTLNLLQAATVNATHLATSSLFPRSSGTCSWSDYDRCYDLYIDCWDDNKASGEIATYDGSCYNYTCWDDHKYRKQFLYFVLPALGFLFLGYGLGFAGGVSKKKAEQEQQQQQQQQEQQRRQQRPVNQASTPASAPAPAPATYPPPIYVPGSSNPVSSQGSSSLQQIPLDDVVVHSSAYRIPHTAGEGSSGSLSEEPVIVEEEDEVPKRKPYRRSEEHVW